MLNSLSLVILAGDDYNTQKKGKYMNCVGPKKEFVVEYSIYNALSIGIKHIVFVINQDFDIETKKYFQHIIESQGGTVEFILQTTYTAVSRSIYDKIEHRKKSWGNAHALMITKRHLMHPFIVIKSNEYYGIDAFIKAKELIENGTVIPNRYAMIAYELDKTFNLDTEINREVCSTNQHFLTSIDSPKTYIINEENEFSVNVDFWIFHPSIFRSLEDQFEDFLKENASELEKNFTLSDVIIEMMKENQLEVKVENSNQNWIEIIERENEQEVNHYIQELIHQHKYPNPLWK
jgi:dTDP-glucose pyrophosphorylase